jgi:hypothetical protein
MILDNHAGIGQKEQLITQIPAGIHNGMLGLREWFGYLKQRSRQEKIACQRMSWPSRRKLSAPM